MSAYTESYLIFMLLLETGRRLLSITWKDKVRNEEIRKNSEDRGLWKLELII